MQLRREGGNIIARVKIAGDRVVITDYGKPQASSSLWMIWRSSKP